MAATKASHAEFIDTLAEEIGLSKAEVRTVIAGAGDLLGRWLADGYKITVSGIGIFEPKAKKGRKKGTKVRNPFDGTTKTIKADEPDTVKVKIRPAAGLKTAAAEAEAGTVKKLLRK